MAIRIMHRTEMQKFVQADAGVSGKNIAKQDPSFGHPEKFCSDIAKTNWESATVTTLDDKIIPYITDICKRDPRTGKVVTGGIVSCQDSKLVIKLDDQQTGTVQGSGQRQRFAYGYMVCLQMYLVIISRSL